MPKPTRKLPKLWTVEPTQDGERYFAVRRASDDRMLMTAYKIPAASHTDTAALSVLNSVLADPKSGRLHKALVEKGLATSTGSETFTSYDPSLNFFIVQMRKDADPAPARAALLATVEAVAATPVAEAELKRAVQTLESEFDEGMRASDRLAISLSEAIAVGDWRYLFWARDQVSKVTAADVNRVAAKYYRLSNRTLGEFIPTDKPERAEITPGGDLSTMLAGYTGRAAVAEGEEWDASPANITKRSERIRLTNGLELILVPKKTRAEAVSLQLSLHQGSLETLTGVKAHTLVSPMLTAGTPRYTRAQISEQLDALKSQLSLSLGGATLATTRGNLAPALDLLAHLLRESNFPASEFERARQEALTGIESRSKEPDALAAEAVQKHLNPYPPAHPKYQPTLEEQAARVKAANRDEAMAFYRDFVSTANGQIVLVGDFDPVAVRAQVTRLFGDWSAKHRHAYIAAQMPSVAPTSVRIETPDKSNAALRRHVKPEQMTSARAGDFAKVK